MPQQPHEAPETASPCEPAGALSAGAPEPRPDLSGTPDPGYTAAGVPTFDSVREKIETRYGTATGSAELAADAPEGRTVEEQYQARKKAAEQRLAQIRESMHSASSDPPGTQPQ